LSFPKIAHGGREAPFYEYGRFVEFTLPCRAVCSNISFLMLDFFSPLSTPPHIAAAQQAQHIAPLEHARCVLCRRQARLLPELPSRAFRAGLSGAVPLAFSCRVRYHGVQSISRFFHGAFWNPC